MVLHTQRGYYGACSCCYKSAQWRFGLYKPAATGAAQIQRRRVARNEDLRELHLDRSLHVSGLVGVKSRQPQGEALTVPAPSATLRPWTTPQLMRRPHCALQFVVAMDGQSC